MAAAVAGVLVLALHPWLAGLYALPERLLVATGVVNLLYSAVSFTLATRSRGDRVPGIRVVAAANMAWAVVCVALAAVWAGVASVFGMAQLVGEGLFVGGLGVLEWQAGGRQGGEAPAGEKCDIPG
jgi:hypothetical protein